MKPNILVCCATSIATSTMVATSLRDELYERGIDANVTQCSFAEIESKILMLDPIAMLVTGVVKDYDIPVIVATPMLTGIGRDEVIEQVIDIINNYYEKS